MTSGGLQSAQARVGNVLEDPPHHLVPDTAHSQGHSLVDSPRLQDQERLRSVGPQREAAKGWNIV